METQKWKKKKERAFNEGNSDAYFFACKQLAEIYYSQQDYNGALSEYKEMLKTSKATGNKMDVALAHRMIGEVYSEQGAFTKAIKHQDIYLSVARSEGNRVEEQRALFTLGRTHYLQAESASDKDGSREAALVLAKDYYHKSLNICEELDTSVGVKQHMEMRARLFLNIGLLFESQNYFDESIKNMTKGVALCKKYDLWDDLYRMYIALGAVHQKQGQHRDAISMYDQAIITAKRLGNEIECLCEALPLKAEALLDLPDFRGARQAFLKSYKASNKLPHYRPEFERKLRIVAALSKHEKSVTELSPDSDNATLKKIYEEMGDMAAELEKFSLALVYYHLMLECLSKGEYDNKTMIDAYVSLAQTYKDNKQYKKALDFFKKELELEAGDPAEACKTHQNIADVWQLIGDNSKMCEAFENAKSAARLADSPRLLISALRAYHSALIEQNMTAEADVVFEEMDKLPTLDSFDSDDESVEDERKREFGEDIDLSDLTDDEPESQTKTVRQRSKPKTNLQKRNEKGETPLHGAAISGNVTLVQKLIDQGHAVDVKDYSGWTPLHEAANHGHNEIVEILVKNGASVNDRGGAVCDGLTPLLDAACNGYVDIIHTLLRYGASPLVRTNKGETVIDCLADWRKRRYEEVGVDLEGSDLSAYESLFNHLKSILEKAGQSVNTSKDFVPKKSHTRKMGAPPSSSQRYSPRKKLRGSPSPKKFERSSPSGAAEYESVMKALRKKNKAVMPDLRGSKLKIPALVSESEIVDDWLEDDLGEARPSKRRRAEEFVGEPLRKRADTFPAISSRNVFPEDDASSSPPSTSQKSGEGSSSPIRPDDMPSTSCYSNRLKSLNLARRKQSNLMEAGVTKEKVVRHSAHSSLPQGSSKSQDPPFTTSPPPLTPMASVKVKIDDKLLLVPVPDTQKPVGWLAQEVAKRYKSLEGVEPVLRLTTDEGAMLVETDPIALIFPCNLLIGRVQSWKIEALNQIYKEACLTANMRCDRHLYELLQASQATCSLSLEDLNLPFKKIHLVLKALAHHYPLQNLELCGNNISDINIQEVAECVSRLPVLKSLDISNTNLTSDGLEKFITTVKQHKGLQSLCSLNLGFNSLGPCAPLISSLLTLLPSLTSLSMIGAELKYESSSSSFADLSLENLEVLDLNHNEISIEGVREVLGRLDGRKIVSLSLSHTSAKTVREVALFLQHHSPPQLTTLDLSYCPATTEDLDVLSAGLKDCPNIKIVNLEGALESISPDVLSTFISSATFKNLNLGGVLCNPLSELVNYQLPSMSISSCNDEAPFRSAPYAYRTTVA